MKFHPGYLALAPLAPLGAAVAHAVLMPKKKSAYQPQPDADRAMAYAEKLAAMSARLKALDEQILKLENTDIIGIVRENGLTIEQLAKLMAMLDKKPTASLPDEYRRTEEIEDEE